MGREIKKKKKNITNGSKDEMETLNTLNRDTVVCYPWWELFVKSVNGWQLERGQQGTTRTRAGTQLATFWYIFLSKHVPSAPIFFFEMRKWTNKSGNAGAADDPTVDEISFLLFLLQKRKTFAHFAF